MQHAPEMEVRHYPDAVGRSLSLPSVLAQSRTYAFLAIIALGAGLRLYGIASYPLIGDEYNSLVEAQYVGLNWNSIIYSTVMHFWVQFGSSETWLRLPAAIFGVATIPLLFKAAAKLGGWRAGAVAGLLAAISPFNLYHSQEVRFYSLFMFAAAAFLLASINYVQSERTARDRVWILASGLLLLVSHFVGLIAVCAQAAAAFLTIKRRRFTTFAVVAVGIPLLIFGLPILPPVRAALFQLYKVFGNAAAPDVSLTPVSLVSLAKIGFTGFTFIFGYNVYPMRLVLVIAGLVLTAFLLSCGVMRLVQERKWTALAFTYAITVCGVYLVLDSVGGRVANGVAPRHVAFAWPVFILLLAMGLTRFRKSVFVVLLVGMVGVNTFALAARWGKDWSYGPATDYRAAADFVTRWTSPTTAIVLGHRAGAPAEFYFPRNVPRLDLYSFNQAAESNQLAYDRLIVVNYDWRDGYRGSMNKVLARLSENYTCKDGRVDYPLFQYVCDRHSRTPIASTDKSAQVPQPLSVYGFEFQDLKLPRTVNVKGLELKVIGALELRATEGQREKSFLVPRVTANDGLVLLTNVTSDNPPAIGTSIAEITIEDTAGVTTTFPLRFGIETALWSDLCPPNARCETVLKWHKRMAMTGKSSYPGAWRDFQAGIHATTLDFEKVSTVTRVSIRYLANGGNLYIWAVALDGRKS